MDANRIVGVVFELIQSLIDQRVGFLVFLAPNMANLEQRKARNQALGLDEERFQIMVADLVPALELTHDQLRVGA